MQRRDWRYGPRKTQRAAEDSARRAEIVATIPYTQEVLQTLDKLELDDEALRNEVGGNIKPELK